MNGKKQIVLGPQPTGHYWFCLSAWLIANGISVVQVNPYAVKRTKEVEDNSQLKDYTKDPKLIANHVKDGNYGMPYLPEGLYADIRRLSMFRDQLSEDRIRNLNRLHREMKIYFPEYKDAFGKVDGAFCLEILRTAPFPEDLAKLGSDGIRQIWHDAKLRGRGYSRADEILKYVKCSIGLISRFDDVKEIQKPSGLGLVACSSGKHKGETKISHRGRKRLRYWLFQAAKSAVVHSPEFKELHQYYTTRNNNPLKKMQSLIVIACSNPLTNAV